MEPFKNAISPALVRLTGTLLARNQPGVDPDGFANSVIPQLEPLALKQRVDLLASALHEQLPADTRSRNDILLAMLHPDDTDHANAESDDNGLCGWGLWPLTTVIGRYGLMPWNHPSWHCAR